MSKNTDTFDIFCGNCAGLEMADITIDDVRAQASIYGASEDEIQRAIAGLIEYQAMAILADETEHLMEPNSGRVQTREEWEDDYSNTDPELWGGPDFEDADLIPVKMVNGEWVEK